MARDDPSGFNILPDKLEVDVKHQIERIERVIVDRVIEHEPQLVVDATSTQHDRDMLKIAEANE
jgi:hypothetical protein